MIENYYYNKQIKRWILQFANIFAGMKVMTGKDANGNINEIDVPIHYGSIDRVVAGIGTGFTQNKPLTLPMMSCYLTGIELTPERRTGIGVVDRKTVLKTGGVFPDDLKIVERAMPIPYNLSFELAIYASNTDQSQQLIEQILILFDPILQIQSSDATFDWGKITTVELVGINNEENYPVGTDKRILVWTFQFIVPIWISPPMDVKENYVKKIHIRIGNSEGFKLDEYDVNGELVPFDEIFTEFEVTR